MPESEVETPLPTFIPLARPMWAAYEEPLPPGTPPVSGVRLIEVAALAVDRAPDGTLPTTAYRLDENAALVPVSAVPDSYSAGTSFLGLFPGDHRAARGAAYEALSWKRDQRVDQQVRLAESRGRHDEAVRVAGSPARHRQAMAT